MKLVLYYFTIPFWRAEVTRLALFIGDIPFTDYRIEKEEEAFDMGYEEYFHSGNLCLIEWPEKIDSIIPDDIVKVQIIRIDKKRIVRQVDLDQKLLNRIIIS